MNNTLNKSVMKVRSPTSLSAVYSLMKQNKGFVIDIITTKNYTGVVYKVWVKNKWTEIFH